MQNRAEKPAAGPARLTLGQLLRLSALWFGLQFFWGSQQLVVMPGMVRAYSDASNFGFMYGLIKSVGALFVMATQLTVGFISDHAYSRLGHRRPFVIFGIISGCGAITLFMLAPDYWWLFAAYMLLEITVNIGSVPFQSLLPDLVPIRQHARAGSLMGLMHMSGYLFALIVVLVAGLFLRDAILGYRVILLPVSIVLLLGLTLLTMLGVDELGWAQTVRKKIEGAVRAIRLLPGTVVKFATTAPTLLGCMIHDYRKVELRSQPDLVFLWLSRFTVFLGYAAFIQYIKLHVLSNLSWQDWLTGLGFPAERTESLSDVAFGAIMIFFVLGGLAGNLLAAPLAERYGKKSVIAWGMILAAVVDIPLVLTSSVWTAIACGMGIGVGWGAFIAADWAFACTLMPKQKAGSYMGIWDISTLLPQVISPALAGVLYQIVFAVAFSKLVTVLETPAASAEAIAYQWVMISVPAYFVLGLWLLRYVKEQRASGNS